MHRVVIVGAGFGGLFAAKRLRKVAVAVTVVDGTAGADPMPGAPATCALGVSSS